MLNPTLDRKHIRDAFAVDDRTLVRNIFTEEVAERVYRCLAEETPWETAFVGPDGRGQSLAAERWGMLSIKEQRELAAQIQQRAQQGFQFLYQKLAILKAYREGLHPGLYHHRLIEFLCSWDFIQFARDITGDSEINRVSAQATRYVAGNYLKKHNDFDAQEDRRYAYVLNFTREWQSDWGGLLHFLDDDDNIVDTYKPVYNGLAIFKVPRMHIVSYVPPYVSAQRLSITGWFTVAR